ncbi:MAG: cyclopropane-fatty-acyl-phospholipid synthase family protein [Bacteroidia bacterium]|jgi:cyclopropane-fatty-acyl-phospholipid synthase|nr:cyclopropane-fatty-acyl-phospholipid synthase family protein [Bacteroidia bacterium]
MNIDNLLERNLLPDILIRTGIRRLLRQRLRDEKRSTPDEQYAHFMQQLDEFSRSPVAVETKAANEQHYEVPTAFYQYCLGPHLKYSSGFWKPGTTTLAQAEEDMLALTCSRAQLENGHHILELGCGWGSLTLYMAAKFPQSKITAVSNSRTQKQYIDSTAAARGLTNITIITADMNVFDTAPAQFDRVVSVEMFEHMRNHGLLLERISRWLKPEGKLFVHIFTHKAYIYLFESKDETDWMSRYFFTGGMMPSDHYLLYWNKHLHVTSHWRVCGEHYGKTAEAWLKNMDAHKAEILPLFAETYGKENVTKWWVYWRVFYMACAELWNFEKGEEWFVSHYLFEK